MPVNSNSKVLRNKFELSDVKRKYNFKSVSLKKENLLVCITPENILYIMLFKIKHVKKQ